MARIKMVEIIDDLSVETTKSLSAAVKEVLPNSEFDEQILFRSFRKALNQKCYRWSKVRDSCIDLD